MGAFTDMLATTADLVGSVSELMEYKVEAKTKAMERKLIRLITWCCLFCMGLLVLLGGLVFLVWGAWALLAEVVGAGVSALIIGAVIAFIALIILLGTSNMTKT